MILVIYDRDKVLSFELSAPMKCRTDWYQADRSVRCSTIDFRMLFATVKQYIHRKNLNHFSCYMVYHIYRIWYTYIGIIYINL